MYKPGFVLQNETLYSHFEIQMDHLIPARRLNPLLIGKKRTCYRVGFDVPVDHNVKIKESEIKD